MLERPFKSLWTADAVRPKYVPACEAFQHVCCGVWGVKVGVARRAKNSALHCFFTPVQIPLVAYATRPKYFPACKVFLLVCCGVWGVKVGVARRAKNSALHCFLTPVQIPLGKTNQSTEWYSDLFLARPKGFEPPISGIGIRCVIQLRHGRIFLSNSILL